MGEKGVGKLSRETPPPREGEPMGAGGGGWAITKHHKRLVKVVG